MVSLTVWDTAGQEVYANTLKGYYLTQDGAVIVYDVLNEETFQRLSKWLKSIKTINRNAVIVIAGNKTEAPPAKRAVPASAAGEWVRAEELEHFDVSAKSGLNVDYLFYHLVKKILSSKGILPFLEDSLLRQLGETGQFLSGTSAVSEQLDVPDTIQEGLDLNVDKSPDRSAELSEKADELSEDIQRLLNIPQDEVQPNELSANDQQTGVLSDPTSDESFVVHRFGGPSTFEGVCQGLSAGSLQSPAESLEEELEDTLSTHSAESAIEYFDSLGGSSYN